ncbi:MAG: hypothetical protein NC337_07705 [Roseburia sp.]|nr:hypothetical protein [Roseburia sp.]
MRRTKIAAAALALTAAVTLTGCGGRKAYGREQERVEEETEPAWESGEEETEPDTALKTYWTVSVEDYTVSLQDGIPDASLKLVLRQGSTEKVLQTYEKGKNYNTPEEFTAEAFERLLGHNGFCVYENYESFGYLTNYYAIENGELVGLAASWTIPGGGERRPDDYMVDLDGDGDRELICNVVYLADGVCATLIYRYDDGLILRGFAEDLLDEEYDGDAAANCLGTEYLPEKEAVRIWYPVKDGQEDAFGEKEYAVDLGRVAMEPYEDTAWW